MIFEPDGASSRCTRCKLEKIQLLKEETGNSKGDAWGTYCFTFNRDPLKRALCFMQQSKESGNMLQTAEEICHSYGECATNRKPIANVKAVINHKDCDKCLMESAALKQHLTEDYLEDLIHNMTRNCLENKDQIEAENCLVGVAQDQYELKVLLTHTIASFCNWIEACHDYDFASNHRKQKSLQSLVKPLQVISGPVKGGYPGDYPDPACDQCLLRAAQVRRSLTPEFITKLTPSLNKLCISRGEDELHSCLERASHFRDMLNYLLEHPVQDYCVWSNVCTQLFKGD